MALLQFDAHSDTWVDDDKARVDHGTIIYKAVKEGLIDPELSVQVGIRVENEPTLGIERIDARSVHRDGPDRIAERIRARIGKAKTYLTFDIDAFDPSAAPGTGTPVWEGLTSAEVAPMLRALAGLNLVGMDVVEVSPPYDHANMTATIGAHVAYELICLWCWTRR
jgi:agmatinase